SIPITTDPLKLKFKLKGLRAGTYYIRAYLDVPPADGQRNGVLDFWEPRGFYTSTVSADRVPSAVDLVSKYTDKNVKVVLRERDTDNDNMPDAWEMWYFGTLAYTGSQDYDGDGISNLEEYATSHLYTSPTLWDTSGDGLSDWFKMSYGISAGAYNPYNPKTNLKGVNLSATDIDTDGDGFSDAMELFVYRTDPLNPRSFPANPEDYATGYGAVADFDGDGRTDICVFNQAAGQWFVLTWDGHYYALPFGWNETTPMFGDYDGDGKTDFAVYYQPTGQWHILTWQGHYYALQFGWNETIPVAGDYDGDGKTDFAVYHVTTGNWYILTWLGHYYEINFGWNETIPVPGDYDGDKQHDLAVYHPTTGNWYVWTWRGQFYQVQFGWNEALPPQKGRR
ncbi:MAG: VCBS repeat-containing protein, partial [Lentisphaerae bacterium]|nr:VCBS repeat-containing protein [Lentisphaerota bacterium]